MKLNEIQGQGGLLREEQRVTELQRQFRTKDGEVTALREQLNEFHGQGERLREEHQRVTELQGQLTTYEGEMRLMREQLNATQELENPDNVIITQNEIQITDQELGRGGWGIVFRGKFRGCVKQMHERHHISS